MDYKAARLALFSDSIVSYVPINVKQRLFAYEGFEKMRDCFLQIYCALLNMDFENFFLQIYAEM